ncbi:MAG TPA: hypothetical protein VHW05_11450 [Phenylobacterium sp.]|nr:hypothetical protein [Phenylobacterium sp.]
MFAVVISVLLMAAADPAASPVAKPTTATAPPPGSNRHKLTTDAKMICWTEKPAGSHIPARICATREEYEKAQQDAHDALTAQRRTGASLMSNSH